MAHSVREIAAALGAEAEGDLDLRVRGAAEPQAAGPDQLALAMDPRYGDGIAKGKARAAVVWPGADWRGMGLQAAIFAPRGRLGDGGADAADGSRGRRSRRGVHPLAVVHPTAALGEGGAIGPFVVIGAGVSIGQGARGLQAMSRLPRARGSGPRR